MQFHPKFLTQSFEFNNAAILTALAPVISSRVENEQEFASACREYLETYGKYLSSISERDLTVALSKAARALQQVEGEAQ